MLGLHKMEQDLVWGHFRAIFQVWINERMLANSNYQIVFSLTTLMLSCLFYAKLM